MPERFSPRLVKPLVATKPPPPEPTGDIGVLSTMSLDDRTQWLRVGVAQVEEGRAGSRVLCIHLGALPANHRFYIPLSDILACCGMERAAGHA